VNHIGGVMVRVFSSSTVDHGFMNHIGGVMVRVFSSSTVDHGFVNHILEENTLTITPPMLFTNP
jgi:hypothetical protein